MAKNILIAFDGTWNTPDTNPDGGDTSTNVFKFVESVPRVAPDGSPQVAWYDEGVGTNWYDKWIGGGLGLGLSTNIRQGYQKLVQEYQPNDRVYVIGFSRGAYTARSLVGFIRKCGVLLQDRDKLLDAAFDLYQDGDVKPDDRKAVQFRDENSRTIGVRFVGVWDTVGALGVPLDLFKRFNREVAGFHDTRLSRIVENAFHAVAIDEHRDTYAATLWDLPDPLPHQKVEQRWFMGAHSDVGGGYAERDLSDITLRWMQEKAIDSGLGIDSDRIPPLASLNHLAPVHDSFQKIFKPIDREIGVKQNGFETLDDSVMRRVQEDGGYRPRGLVRHLERRQVPGFVT